MANVARLRVELKKKYNDSDKNFKDMFHDFKRKVSASKVLADYKDHQFYETPSEKERKRKREAAKKTMVESLKSRIQSGEKVTSPAGLVKKIHADLEKDKKDKKKGHKNYRQYNDA